MKQKILFFIGPVYAGKGVQSKRLAEHTGYLHISTGDLCRAEMKKETELGKRIKPLMDQGILVPDVDIYELMRLFFLANPDAQGFIFDGFPRTRAQVDYLLDTMLQESNLDLIGGIELALSDEAILSRFLSQKGADRQGRTDDTEEVIKKRIKDYQEKTLPNVMYMLNRKVEIFTLDGEPSPDQVWEDILTQWGKLTMKS